MNKKSKVFAFVVLLILTATGWSVYNLFQETEDAPPSIESFQKTLQGNIRVEDRYYTWEEIDLDKIEKPTEEATIDLDKIEKPTEEATIDLDKIEKPTEEATIDLDKIERTFDTGEATLAAEPSTNYIYFEEETSIEAVFEKIVPTEKGGVYFLVFNPKKDACVSGEEGFISFKEPDSANTVKAYCTIILYTKEETSISEAKSSNNGISAEQYEGILDSFKEGMDEDMWVLTPIPTSKEDFQSIENINISILENSKDEEFKSVVTDYEAIEIETNAYIAWTKIEKPEELQKITSDSGESIIEFNGVDAYHQIDDEYLVNTGEITISAWVKIDKNWAQSDKQIDGTIISVAGHSIGWDPLRKLKVTFRIRDKNFGVDTKSLMIKSDQWYFVAGTYDGGTIKFYVDGELIESLTKSGELEDVSGDTIYLGSKGGESKFFGGAVKEASILNKPLSQEEIMDIYEAGM